MAQECYGIVKYKVRRDPSPLPVSRCTIQQTFTVYLERSGPVTHHSHNTSGTLPVEGDLIVVTDVLLFVYAAQPYNWGLHICQSSVRQHHLIQLPPCQLFQTYQPSSLCLFTFSPLMWSVKTTVRFQVLLVLYGVGIIQWLKR